MDLSGNRSPSPCFGGKPTLSSLDQMSFGPPYHFSSVFKKRGELSCKILHAIRFLRFLIMSNKILIIPKNCTKTGILVVNQILKALEPVFSAGLSAAIFHTYLSSHQVLYMMLAVSGACLAAFKDLQFNWFAFSMAFLSNVSFATRNVFLKLSPQNQQSSSLEQQGKISICAAVFLIPHWSILCMSRTNEIAEILYDFSMLKSLIIVAVSHTIYNYCSITVLSNVENVVQHALLNIMKRPFTIITMSFTNTNQSDLTPTTVMGVMVLVTGQILFKFNPTCKSSRKRRLRIRNLRVVKLLPLIVLMTPFFFYSGKLMTQSR